MIHSSIESLDDPRLAPYRDLKDTNRTRWLDRFVAEGEKLTLRLLESSCRIHSVLVERTHLERLRPCLPHELDVLVVENRLVSQIVGFNFHRGVLACGYRPENVALESIAAKPGPLRLVVLGDVQDPENLGAIIRTSVAFGANAILLGPACADPFSRRVLRTSMGGVWRVPLRRAENLVSDLRRLREQFDVQVIATVLADDARPLYGFAPPERWALLLGNEGHGLGRECVEQCQQRITMPMQAGTDSLNVAIAAGIFLYELTRRR